jgi:hypothetical protein
MLAQRMTGYWWGVRAISVTIFWRKRIFDRFLPGIKEDDLFVARIIRRLDVQFSASGNDDLASLG